jgi:hypothetical protein
MVIASKYGGTGLGLVSQMMIGDITVASEPGKGSVFTLRLPGGVAEDAPITGVTEYLAGSRGSLRLNARELDHLVALRGSAASAGNHCRAC